MLSASPHKFLATSLLCNMALAISWITLFFLSITPFCWKVIGVENSWDIPTLVQKDSTYEFSNSLPWPLRIRSIFRLFSFYNLVHKASICSRALDLDRRSMTQVYLVKSSTMKSWSHIWLMLNRFILRPLTYRTFAMSSSLGKEMIPFPLIYDLLPSPKVTLPTIFKLENLEERSVSSYVSWAATVKIPQAYCESETYALVHLSIQEAIMFVHRRVL